MIVQYEGSRVLMQREPSFPIERAARPRLLAVLAHPDDETYGTGGTLALYSWAGAEVSLICTTGGEAGEVGPAFLERYGSALATRTAELQCAAEKLGLAQVYMLGYRDSGMTGSAANAHPDALTNALFEEVITRITHLIRKLRPHVVITFDPIGGYRHPDHIVTHNATVRAFRAAGDPTMYPGDLPAYQPQKLYFLVTPKWLLRIFVSLMPLFGKDPKRFGANQDVDLTQLVNANFPAHARIDYTIVQARREAAVACHASQNVSPTISQSVFGKLIRIFAGGESFMQGYPEPTPGPRERDLFAGVTIDA